MKAVLLDRDGTVIAEPPDERVESEQEIRLFDDSITALRLLAENGYAVIFITNQAGIAEGLLSEADFWRIHSMVLARLAPSGITVLKTYMCPHGPADGCACRKPQPGMLLQAAADYDLDLAHTYMVGDRASDIAAGIASGAQTILVKTGPHDTTAPGAAHTAATLLDAVQYIVGHDRA